jgi:hypothetical protein
MGLTRADAVTLMGAHTLGHVHKTNSGYGLPIDPTLTLTSNAFDLTPDAFDNSYYQALIGVGWDNHMVQDHYGSKNHWLFQVNETNDLNQLILLNTDMINAFPIDTTGPGNTGVTFQEFPDGGQTCETYPGDEDVLQLLSGPGFTPLCTPNRLGQTLYSNTTVPTYAQFLRYIDVDTGNAAFLNDFAISYAKMVSVGYGSGGRMGMLTPFNFTSCPAIMSQSEASASKPANNEDAYVLPLVAALVSVGGVIIIGFAAYFCFDHSSEKLPRSEPASDV